MKTLLFVLMLLISELALAQKILVIVNASNPLNSISSQQLQDFYFKRAKQWPDGSALRFFDRSEGSEERKEFLSSLLHRSTRQVDHFWIGQKLYSGASAPSQVNSDRMVTSLVARFPGGISYVSENFTQFKGVKVLTVTGD
ncbi:MAG TPA: hypothetical protein VNJ01_16450 [Bacteriovoracaceae bacterium]|nr:hypothetical protein [Bacteriovoracaceae bacterium]